MSGEAQLLIAVWDVVRDYLPAAKRAECAVGIVRAFVAGADEPGELAGVLDEDRDLADAYEIVADEAEIEDEDESGED